MKGEKNFKAIGGMTWQSYLAIIALILMGLAYFLSIPWTLHFISSANPVQGILYILDLVLTTPLFATCLILSAFFILLKKRRVRTTVSLVVFFYGTHHIFGGLASFPAWMNYPLLHILHVLGFIISGILLVVCAFQLDRYFVDYRRFKGLATWSVICALILAMSISLSNYLYWLPDILNPTLPRADNAIQFVISFLFVGVAIIFAVKCRKPHHNNYWTYIFLLAGLFVLSMHAPRVFEALLRDYDVLYFTARFIWGVAGVFAGIVFLWLAKKSFNLKMGPSSSLTPLLFSKGKTQV